jgi:hypothetical protein
MRKTHGYEGQNARPDSAVAAAEKHQAPPPPAHPGRSQRRKKRLDQAFLLHNAVVAKDRMSEAAVGWAIAAIAIGLSLFFLATAPIKEPATAKAATAELVQVSLSQKGQDELQCDVATLQALKIGERIRRPNSLLSHRPTVHRARSHSSLQSRPHGAWSKRRRFLLLRGEREQWPSKALAD